MKSHYNDIVINQMFLLSKTLNQMWQVFESFLNISIA
jgi:hypothetical protein